MEDLKTVFALVEEGITLAGVNAEQCRTHNEGQWNMKAHDVEVWVDLWAVEEEGRNYFQVMAPLVTIPETNAEVFYRELLDLNYQIVGAAFVTYKEGVYLKFMKDAAFLTPEEVMQTLERIGRYGLMFGGGLKQKFGAGDLKHHE